MEAKTHFREPTQSMCVCAPELVWEYWQEEQTPGQPLAVMFAATLLRWLQVDPARRIVRMNQWVRHLPHTAWHRGNLEWRTLLIPGPLADAAKDAMEQECLPAWGPGWWAASMLDLTLDDSAYVSADGTRDCGAGAHALGQLAQWEQRQAFIEAMQAAGCDMGRFDALAEVPSEGPQLAGIRRRRA